MEQEIQRNILSLIKKRKNYLNMIEQNMNNSDSLFIKCFRLSENINPILNYNKSASSIMQRNFFLLCSLLSNTIYIQNSYNKLNLIYKICEQYEIFEQQKIPYNAKFQISQLSRLAVNPTRTDIGLNIHENITSQELQKDLQKMAKTITLPEEMSFPTVLESLCNVLNLTYNMFADSSYSNKDCLEIITKIDNTIYSKFIQPLIDVYFQASEQLITEDFQKLNEIIFDEDKHLEYTSIYQMIQDFENSQN
ncbi:hypothetical protein ABPG72_006966 [Tetrahymena utriculariae]